MQDLARDECGPFEQANAPPIVFVVDDDVSVREALELLIRNEGWQAVTFQIRAGVSRPRASRCSELPGA